MLTLLPQLFVLGSVTSLGQLSSIVMISPHPMEGRFLSHSDQLHDRLSQGTAGCAYAGGSMGSEP